MSSLEQNIGLTQTVAVLSNALGGVLPRAALPILKGMQYKREVIANRKQKEEYKHHLNKQKNRKRKQAQVDESLSKLRGDTYKKFKDLGIDEENSERTDVEIEQNLEAVLRATQEQQQKGGRSNYSKFMKAQTNPDQYWECNICGNSYTINLDKEKHQATLACQKKGEKMQNFMTVSKSTLITPIVPISKVDFQYHHLI